MTKLQYSSNRYFIIFDYFPSHGKLLLRSQKVDESPNIDIIFQNVKYISTPTNFKGLRLSIAANVPAEFEIFTEYSTIFKIESENKSSYIVAGLVNIYENELEFHESSLIWSNLKGRGNQIFSIPAEV